MNSTKSILFLDTENGDFFLINGVVISSKTTFSSLRELFPDNDIWDVGTGFYLSRPKNGLQLFCQFNLCFSFSKLSIVSKNSSTTSV